MKCFIICAMLLVWGVGSVSGTLKTSIVAGGYWNTAGTWSPFGVPAATDQVVITGPVNLNTNVNQNTTGTLTINNGGTLTVTTNNGTFMTLTINSGGTLTCSRVLTINGTTDITGTISLSGGRANVFTGNVTLNTGASWTNTTTSTQTFSSDFINKATTFSSTGSGIYTFTGSTHNIGGTTVSIIPNVAINNTYTNNGTLTVGTALSGSGTLTNSSTGTLKINGTCSLSTLTNNGNIISTGSGTITSATVTNNLNWNMDGTGAVTNFTNAASGTLIISATPAVPAFTTLTANATGNTVNYDGTGTQTIAVLPYSNLTLSGSGTKTLGNALITNGAFNIGSGVTLSTGNNQLTFGGDFINTGTLLNAGSSPIVIAGTATTQNIAGFTTTGLISMTKTAGTATFTGPVNGASLTMSGTGGTLNLGTGLTHTLTGVYTSTNGTLNGGTNTILNLSGTFGGAGGTFACGTSTINYNGAGAQTVAVIPYYNLMFSAGGAKSVTSAITINNNLSITGAATASIIAGVTLTPVSLTLGGFPTNTGAWGSSASSATYKNDIYFAPTAGMVNPVTDTRLLTAGFTNLTSSQSICNGTATVTLSGTVSAAGPVYPANLENVKIIINGGTIQNAVISGGVGGFLLNYNLTSVPVGANTITYSYTGNGFFKAAPNNTTTALTVNAVTTISSQSTATQTQCIGGAFTPITVTATGTSLTYQWYRNTTNSTSGGTSLLATNGAQTNSYTPQTTSTGTLYYYCIITGTCGTVTSSASEAFLVNPLTSITGQSTSAQTQCVSSSFTPITVTATGTGTLTYQWYSNVASSTNGGTSLFATNGAQTSSYTPQSTTAGTLYYYCIVTGTCSTATSSVSGAFLVNPATTISGQSTAAQTRCIGNSFTSITVTATGTGTLTYQWFKNTTNSTSGGTSLAAANGAQTSSYTPQSTTAGTLYYYCIVTGTCATSTSTVSGAFIVNPATTISSQSTAAQTQCIGVSFTPITVTATGTNINYQWYSNTTNSTTGGASLVATNGAQTSSYAPQSTSTGTLYYYCIVSGTCGAVTSSASGAFLVNPATAITSQSTAAQTQCLGSSFTPITVTATGTGTLTYQWYSNTTSSTTGGASLSAANGAQTSSYTPQSTTAGTLYYYCIVSGTCASATSAVSGAFLVNPLLPVSVSIVSSANDVCPNTSVIFTPTIVNGGTPNYTWKVNAVIVDHTSTYSYIPDNGDVVTCEITSSLTCASGTPAISNAVTMIVRPLIDNNTLDYTNGLHGTLSATAPEGGTATMTAPAGTVFINIGFASYGSPGGISPNFTITSCHAFTSQSVVETAFLGMNSASILANNGNFGDPCIGTTKKLDVLATYTQPICNGTSPGTILGSTPTGGNGTYTYSWEISTTSAASGFTTLASATLKDYTAPNLTQTTWYRRTVTSGGCSSASVIQIPVYPAIANNTISSAQTICSGSTPAAFTGTLPTGGTGTYTYLWESSITGASTGFGTATGTSNSQNYSPSALVQTTWYRRTVITGGCNDISTAILITVNPTPLAPTTTSVTVSCIGNGVTLTATGASTGDKYLWYDAATAGNLKYTSTDYTNNTYLTPALTLTTSYWVSILSAAGCEGPRTIVTATMPLICTDPQTPGADSWIGYVYEGTNFSTYYGHYTEPILFDESFGGNASCFPISSSLNDGRSIYTETFSVRYLMNTTKKGLYTVDMGSDDGNRLNVDGVAIYNDWGDHGVITHSNVLMNLTGSNLLTYDFYENGGGNRVFFQNLTQVIANTLSFNTIQTVILGDTGTPISGDTFGALGTGISSSGTGYQWTYSTILDNTRINIPGANADTYSPNTTILPFNAPGTYYLYRNAILSSVNNVAPNPYVATNESNVATLTVKNKPVITTAPASLTGFTYQFNTGASAQQSFTVSATYLIANVTVTPTASFEISTTSGTGFQSTPITLFATGGVVNSTTLYVRMKAGIATGTVSAENIAISTNYADTKYVACSGTVTGGPALTITSIPAPFNYNYTKGPSTEQSFTITGSLLVANVTVTPPPDYEISTTTGANYVSTPITLTKTGTTLNTTTIYVRMKVNLGIGDYNENIVVASTGISNNVACTGTVFPSGTIYTNTSSLSTFIYTFGASVSNSQSFQLTGTNLGTNNVIITPPANFEISLSSGTGFAATLTITPSSGSINTTIYARLKLALTAGNYGPLNITLASLNAVGKSVAVSGSVVGAGTPTILTSKTSLSGFGYLIGTGPSTPQSFTVSGASLTSDITVACPINYEISLSSGSGYSTANLILPNVSGTVSPTTIFVHLKSGLAAATYPGVNISLASLSVTPLTVVCTGIVFASPLITASGGGILFCQGSTINLISTGPDIQNRYWLGPNSYYSILQSPVLTTNATAALNGTYSVTGNVIVGGNLVTNGDFETGNASFGSSYNLSAGGSSGLVPEKVYAVIADPSSQHSNFSKSPDHTIGGSTCVGLQMVINGAPVAGAVVWTQSVPVIPGASYEFIYWVQSVNGAAPSQLQLFVNGALAGPIYTADSNTGNWKQFIFNASAGSNTVLNLELINENIVSGGNDFALDDISFKQILPATSSVDVFVNPTLPVSVSISASSTSVYTNTPVTFTATPTNGGTNPTYVWKVNGLVNASSTSGTFTYTPINNDAVTCIMTSNYPCISTGNPATSNSVSIIVIARTNYWLGTIDTVWGKIGNWSQNYIPLAGDDVEYGPAAKNDLTLDNDYTIGNLINSTTKRLVIPPTRSLIVNYSINTGIGNNPDLIYIGSSSTLPNGSLIFHNPVTQKVYATVEMYSKAFCTDKVANKGYKWQYFGIPVESLKASPTLDGSYIRRIDETAPTATHWVPLTNSSTLTAFAGYEITQPDARTLVFQGRLVNWNNTPTPLAYTSTGSPAFAGQYLFANPFTAAIDISGLSFGSTDAGIIENTVYLFSTGSSAEWLGVNGVPITDGQIPIPGQYTAIPIKIASRLLGLPDQVPPMQGILVRVHSNSPLATFSIPYSAVSIKNTYPQRSPADKNGSSTGIAGTLITVNSKRYSDKMWIFTEPTCTRKFDNGWDGTKIMGDALTPQIFAIEPDGNYQVDALADVNNTLLGFQAGEDINYSLTFTHENLKNNYTGMFLLDLLTTKITEITESGTTYSFSAESSTAPVKRFVILTSKNESDIPSNSNHLKVFNTQNTVFVQNLSNLNGEMIVYNMAGRTIKRTTFGPFGITAVKVGTIPGPYIVKATTADEKATEKIIIGKE